MSASLSLPTPSPPPLLLQLQVEAVADAPKTLTLDTRDLTLYKVALLSGFTGAAVTGKKGSAEQSLQYVLAEKHPVSPACPTKLLGVLLAAFAQPWALEICQKVTMIAHCCIQQWLWSPWGEDVPYN
jgi:hypothetical protein